MNRTKRARKIVSVILAAGKGTRMGSPNIHKVCFPLEGGPVIARAIETYQRCGMSSHFVVVGQMAEQVMRAASSVPADVFFCFQPEQRGTGNAAKEAARLLSSMDYEGDVFVVAGDKVIEDPILHELIDTFYETDSDLAFVVGDANAFPSSGRVVYGEQSQVLGIVEVFDIARMQLLLSLRRIAQERLVTADEAKRQALAFLRDEKKAMLALGELWDSIEAGIPITKTLMDSHFDESDYSLKVNGANLSPELLANVRHANLSVYLFKAKALYKALDRLSSDNAQQEEYLTDTIGILAADGCRLRTVSVAYPEQVMAFNTREELKAIEDYLAKKKSVEVSEAPKAIRTARQWLRCFESDDADVNRFLITTYREGDPGIAGKRRMLASMLRSYLQHFGDQEVRITRAPGRVNIMGRHVDHQGGHCNMIAIDRDVYAVVGDRDDREVHLHNIEPHHFPSRHFQIEDVICGYEGGDWLDYVNSHHVIRRVAEAQGDWSQYVKAPLARLQVKYPHRHLRGMNVVVGGDIPIAAGLSSSSAVVVAIAEAVVSINELDISPQQFVELCGEAEWYVGTRGGAGDQAAMKFGRKGHVVQIGCFPFGVTDTVPFPTGHMFVVCDSHQKARKTAGARDIFNHRVACYHIGRELLKQEFPRYAPAIEHLRDFNVRNLGVTYAELLRMLKRLPVSMTRQEVLTRLPSDIAERYLSTHADTFDSYPVRSVVLFGLSECERSRACPTLLRRQSIGEFGRWMNVSHDGDRVVRWDRAGNSLPFMLDYSDDTMDRLATEAETDPAGDGLASLSGGYSCSIPQIDHMVDIALSVEGVLGAQVLGAGLGGCILVLLREESYEDLNKALEKHYYLPANTEPVMFPCYPVAGSGIVAF